MAYALLKLLHLGAVVIWLGGMFFTLYCLRPAAAGLPPPQRVPFMADVLRRFFGIVQWVVLAVLGSGLAMIALVTATSRKTGVSFNMPADWMVMAGVGVLMAAIFGHVRFALYKRLARAAAAQDWQAGGAALTEIRFWVGANLALGAVVLAVVRLGSVS